MPEIQTQTNKKITKSPLEKNIQDFLEYCEIEKNKSLLTIRNYAHYLARFAAFCKTQGLTRPEDIVLDTVRSFRLFLRPGLAPGASRRTTLLHQQQ